ncbi:hypothetical protein K4G60_g3066 [Candida parapsilosis]|nr:hypothetical protein K4G60_g3066 [Candida parapsilosis]KAI5910630.1 hypothetical protein K4G61_g4330 [Candida parapsilosis]
MVLQIRRYPIGAPSAEEPRKDVVPLTCEQITRDLKAPLVKPSTHINTTLTTDEKFSDDVVGQSSETVKESTYAPLAPERLMSANNATSPTSAEQRGKVSIENSSPEEPAKKVVDA